MAGLQADFSLAFLLLYITLFTDLCNTPCGMLQPCNNLTSKLTAAHEACCLHSHTDAAVAIHRVISSLHGETCDGRKERCREAQAGHFKGPRTENCWTTHTQTNRRDHNNLSNAAVDSHVMSDAFFTQTQPLIRLYKHICGGRPVLVSGNFRLVKHTHRGRIA